MIFQKIYFLQPENEALDPEATTVFQSPTKNETFSPNVEQQWVIEVKMVTIWIPQKNIT
jgi:hypothetical protein